MANQTSSNIRIALLVLAALAIAIFGINFLKGKNLFGSPKTYSSTFAKGHGIKSTNPVMLNGVQVGRVESVALTENLKSVMVTYSLNENIQLPADSEVSISPGIPGLSPSQLVVKLGDSGTAYDLGAQIKSNEAGSMTDQAQAILNDLEPTAKSLKSTMNKLDSTATNLNQILSGQNARNIESMLANLEVSMRNLNQTTSKVNTLVDEQSVKIDGMLSNLYSISNNLKENQKYIDNALENFSKTSDELASLELKKTLDMANETVAKLNGILDKINDGDGSLSLLLNDAELYNNLNNTARDLDRLILDIKEDPSEVVPSISIFGGKKNKK